MSTNVTFVGFLGRGPSGQESIRVVGQCEGWLSGLSAEEAVGRICQVKILANDMRTTWPVGGEHSPAGPHRCYMIVGPSEEKVEVELQLEYVEREGVGAYEGTAKVLQAA